MTVCVRERVRVFERERESVLKRERVSLVSESVCVCEGERGSSSLLFNSSNGEKSSSVK